MRLRGGYALHNTTTYIDGGDAGQLVTWFAATELGRHD